jgi:hypothetical protein
VAEKRHMALGQFRRVGVRRFGRQNCRYQPDYQWENGNRFVTPLNAKDIQVSKVAGHGTPAL